MEKYIVDKDFKETLKLYIHINDDILRDSLVRLYRNNATKEDLLLFQNLIKVKFQTEQNNPYGFKQLKICYNQINKLLRNLARPIFNNDKRKIITVNQW